MYSQSIGNTRCMSACSTCYHIKAGRESHIAPCKKAFLTAFLSLKPVKSEAVRGRTMCLHQMSAMCRLGRQTPKNAEEERASETTPEVQ